MIPLRAQRLQKLEGMQDVREPGPPLVRLNQSSRQSGESQPFTPHGVDHANGLNRADRAYKARVPR